MAENSGTVAIVVALIGAAGLIGAKYLDIIKPAAPAATVPAANPPAAPGAVVANGPAATTGPAAAGTTSAAPPATLPRVPASGTAGGSSTATITRDDDVALDDPRKLFGPGTAVADVSGAWHDSQHQNYIFAQTGGTLRMVGPLFPMGMMATVGSAGIQWTFTEASGVAGTCSGPLVGDQLQITCYSVRGPVPMPFHRPST